MGQAAANYLALRRALGTRLRQPGQLLRDFAAGLDARGITRLTVAEALAWAAAPAGTSPYWHGWRLGVLRGWSRYLHAMDPVHAAAHLRYALTAATYRTLLGLLATTRLFSEGPNRYKSGNFIDRPGRAADNLSTRPCKVLHLLRLCAGRAPEQRQGEHHTPADVLRKLSRRRSSTTSCNSEMTPGEGIRPGEAFGLDRGSVGMEAGILTVVSTKTSQIRTLGLHDTAIAALAGYARRRDLLCPHPAQPYFLLSVRGTRLNATIADRTFLSLARTAGVTARPDGTRPLLRSFLHTFAVTTILRWYRDGTDVDAAMPALSAWLGHSNPRDTYWYYSDCRVIPIAALLPV